MGKKTTISKYTFTLEEIIIKLKINEEIISCGFNPKQKYKNIKDKVLIIRTKDVR